MTKQETGREYYIDHLRVVMTAMVIFAHAAITYGGTGSWFDAEIVNQQARSSMLLSLYVITCNASLMGFFFLLAGYFTPAALERKGYASFLGDRSLRLGVPLLLFGLVVAPVTIGLVAHADGHGFLPAVLGLWGSREFVNGPMWFAEALLIFSLGFCLVHFAAGRFGYFRQPSQQPGPVPGWGAWMVSALFVGLATLLLRQIFPVDRRIIGLWMGAFASYIFLYAVGVMAWQRNWLVQLDWPTARPTLVMACLAWPALPVGVAAFAALHRGPESVRGFDLPNIALAFWEPLVGWGIIAAGLLWFRTRVNRNTALWAWLSRRAYAVYFLHPLVLVGITLLLRPWHGPAMVKAVVAGSLGCAVTWLAADGMIRMPWLRRVF